MNKKTFRAWTWWHGRIGFWGKIYSGVPSLIIYWHCGTKKGLRPLIFRIYEGRLSKLSDLFKVQNSAGDIDWISGVIGLSITQCTNSITPMDPSHPVSLQPCPLAEIGLALQSSQLPLHPQTSCLLHHLLYYWLTVDHPPTMAPLVSPLPVSPGAVRTLCTCL